MEKSKLQLKIESLSNTLIFEKFDREFRKILREYSKQTFRGKKFNDTIRIDNVWDVVISDEEIFCGWDLKKIKKDTWKLVDVYWYENQISRTEYFYSTKQLISLIFKTIQPE